MHVQAENPSGSNLNALGVYMMSCLIFVVGALIEFAIVLLINRSSASLNKNIEKSNVAKTNNQMVTEASKMCWKKDENVNEITETERTAKPMSSLAQRLVTNIFPRINTIDICAFWVHFCLFVLFNCFYWLTYLAN